MPHLFVALSPHGFGHAAMTAPVVGELRRLRPDLAVTLQSPAPRRLLETRYPQPFAVIQDNPDFGVLMTPDLAVAVAPTAARYRALHADFAAVVEREAERLRRLAVDAVLSNVSYVALAAAARAGIPALAMCCLNWADIYRHFCGARPEAPEILAVMEAAYGGAPFLRTQPAMPMPSLPHARAIGPVCRVGQDRRAELRAQLRIAADTRVALMAFGGIDLDMPLKSWPSPPGWHFVAALRQAPRLNHMTPQTDLAMDFTDLLRSADVVITKPGYGTFTEAAANGVAVLSMGRPDWPEAATLEDWLEGHGRCLRTNAADLAGPTLGDQLQALLSLPAKPLVAPNGVEPAAQAVLALLA